ncbi:tumor necrosis factor receptor superfamily member 6 isoform X2 [Paroedura picta]|uniref:tumor necrosis factor receptor superfamily member 6 isoform X2 n=1 Tax=Paroedura picta TaxID=143630 RepID=UPI004056EC7A
MLIKASGFAFSVNKLQRRKVIAAGPSHDNSVPVIQCDLCEPGRFKVKNCTASEKTVCEKCEEGKEYTDHPNHHSKCKRCNSCDSAHGFEVEKPCNITQNIKCRCMHGYFCNSSKLCDHCEPCTNCEGGIVVKECTRTNDTICGKKSEHLPWIIGTVVVLALFVLAAIIWILWGKEKFRSKKPTPDEQKPMELEPLTYPDTDLTPHISEIAELMTLEQVMKFVRKQMLSSPTIDRIGMNNMHDVSEKKIQLLESWHQENGMKGAYGTLMRSLVDLKMRTLADKIKQMMDSHIQSNAKCSLNHECLVEENPSC